MSMLVALTNYPVTLQFIKTVDQQLYQSLNYIKNNDPESLCLNFSIQQEKNNKLRQIDLKEHGKTIEVVESNKEEYLDLYTRKYFYLGKERQLHELKRGFSTVVPTEVCEILNPQELMKMIRGEEVNNRKYIFIQLRC